MVIGKDNGNWLPQHVCDSCQPEDNYPDEVRVSSTIHHEGDLEAWGEGLASVVALPEIAAATRQWRIDQGSGQWRIDQGSVPHSDGSFLSTLRTVMGHLRKPPGVELIPAID